MSGTTPVKKTKTASRRSGDSTSDAEMSVADSHSHPVSQVAEADAAATTTSTSETTSADATTTGGSKGKGKTSKSSAPKKEKKPAVPPPRTHLNAIQKNKLKKFTPEPIPKSAYQLFTDEELEKVRAAHPEVKGYLDQMKLVAAEWKKLGVKDKATNTCGQDAYTKKHKDLLEAYKERARGQALIL